MKNRIHKTSGRIDQFFCRTMYKDPNMIVNSSRQKYWKNRVFHITSISMMISSCPLFLYGAFLFYREGKQVVALLEVLTHIIIVAVLTCKWLSIYFRKVFLTAVFYLCSLMILMAAGRMGAGMICMSLSLFLAGCLYDNKKQIVQYLLTNVAIVTLFTILLYTGVLDQTALSEYKKVWIIDLLTSQLGGVISLLLMNTILNGLENQTAKILHMSYHDSLTGLFNRLYLEQSTKELNNREHLPLSVIMGDINGLKIINDSLGHSEGDKLLITMGRILMENCRKDDIIIRQGGDEFCILLPNTGVDTAQEIIRKINQSCEEFNHNSPKNLFHISISLGTASKTREEETLTAIFKAAEDNMYQHKLLESKSFHSSIITSMKTALLEKSQETEEHARRLIKLTRIVGEVIGLTDQQFDELELLATLHDIGKIGVDDHILKKPGKLSPEEWVQMKKHSEIGYRIAMSSPELMPIAYYILTHHERWDGDGYPQRLKGEIIPLLSRILSVADAYDAMTQDRPYRVGMLQQDAIRELVTNAGTQFDPEIVSIFIDIVHKVESEKE
jgi:diguanylate cyclase (GGDEF)-like protein